MSKFVDLETPKREDEENIFDHYIMEIDFARRSTLSLKGLDFLETVILAFERTLHDFNTSITKSYGLEKRKMLKMVNISVEFLLKNWFEVFVVINQYDI